MVDVQFSGILIYALPGQVEECVREVDKLTGLEVHYCYPDSGRLIAVLETETVSEQESGLRDVQSLPSVAAAELVYHYFGSGSDVDLTDNLPKSPVYPIPLRPKRVRGVSQ